MADGVEESGIYRSLLVRFESLEASHNKIKEQLSVVMREKEAASSSGHVAAFVGGFFAGSPHARVLDCLGHAVYVTTPSSRQIIYWNSAAEKLFGYKDYEVFGKRVINLLFDEEHHPSAVAIMKRLSSGASWSGQLPLKRRSGQIFMAMVTKSPMYEDNELVGIVTVSSDAAVFNSISSESARAFQIHTDDRSHSSGINLRKILWHSQTQNAAVPHIASSVSNLASKILLRKSSDVTHDTFRTTKESVEAEVENEDGKAEKPPRVPLLQTAKTGTSFFPGKSRMKSLEKEESSFKMGFFSKLQMAATNILDKVVDDNIQENAFRDTSVRRESSFEDQRVSVRRDSYITSLDVGNHLDDDQLGISHAEGRNGTGPLISSSNANESSPYRNSSDVPKMKSMDVEDTAHGILESQKVLSSGESHGSGHGSSSSKDETESHLVVDSDIRWEDLQLREQIGQGSYAVVYHGIWNGSDVAVKLYTENQYSYGTLIDYQKEISIMRKLRHPNVLLFMGAVCSEEKLAIVTEYMIRGSLFKTLHRSKQSLDIKRRLKMAIDVSRGMNYLHHRNPPIVHRDLKSSNLLVDKNWTVKVGDFGLSKLKDATFLTTKSGRGTPQWMAPEILRNEPSTEKSDVFSFGVILWELITESIPWNNLNSLQVVGVVGFMDRRLDIPENVDPQISSIISDCWESNPEKRPSFEDIIHRMTNLVHSGAGTMGRTPSTP